jgi:hypothetical protein
VNGAVETVHVKNTGRCKELLLPGAAVRLEVSDNPKRKTKYDLVRDERVHERLSKNYLSVNFSTLHLTLLTNGAITMACSGGRRKERAARLPGRPFRVNNIKIFDPTRTPGLEE